jgi:hypothetical protein
MIAYTLKQIINKESSINYIVHDIDDEWQFLDGDDVDMADLMIVSVEEVVAICPEIKEVLNDIPPGFCAIKNETNAWVISEYEE